MTSNTTGANNIAVGRSALAANTTAGDNIAIGHIALGSCTTGASNTAVGYTALTASTTAGSNTAVGHRALTTNTTGAQNTALGKDAGDLITTGSNITCLGYQADPSAADTSNEFVLGNSSVDDLRCNDDSIAALSDKRDKTEIIDLPYGLDFINKTRPVQFKWDKRTFIEGDPKQGKTHNGFIAQELLALGNNEQHRLVLDTNPEKLEARYNKLIPMLTKAIQELSAKVEDLEDKLNNKE